MIDDRDTCRSIAARLDAAAGKPPRPATFDIEQATAWMWEELAEYAGGDAALIASIEAIEKRVATATGLPALHGTPGQAVAAAAAAKIATDEHDSKGRRLRHDGWTLLRQTAFIDLLREYGCVEMAARGVGMASSGAYALRKRSRGFRAAWDAAITYSALDLERIAMERAIDGVIEVVYDAEGNPKGSKRRYNDRLLMFLLRAARPDKYGAGNLTSDYGREVHAERARMKARG